jgi:twitching motility protein PilT
MDIDILRNNLRKARKENFALDHDGMRLRAVRYVVVNGNTWAALRRIPGVLPDIEDLGFRPEVLQAFRSWGYRKGLIVIGGATGAGKTTTAVSIIKDFLVNIGGTAYTVEDPVEFLMQGPIGSGGFVIQREVNEDPEWGDALKDALRSAPDYIFLGEVRTAAAARQLLRAATSGHLAICTVHGSSVEETLGAIIQIAESELGQMAYNLLADGLTAVVHQNIVRGKPQVRVLQTEAGKYGDPIRAAIRANKLNTLGTEIQRQAAVREQGTGGGPGEGDVRATGGQQRTAAVSAAKAPIAAPKKKSWF